MNTQTSTASGVDGGQLTPEFVAQVFKLTPAERVRLREMLAEVSDEPEGTPEELRREWRDEIQRRLDAIDRGEMEMSTPEEVIARVESRREVRAES